MCFGQAKLKQKISELNEKLVSRDALIDELTKANVEPETVKPLDTEEIDAKELTALLLPILGAGGRIILSDSRHYRLCDYDEVALFLAVDQTNQYPYVKDVYDCDDFTDRLIGQFSIPGWASKCIGCVWTTTHAMAVIITTDREMLFLEPQTDVLCTFEELSPQKIGDGFRFVKM